MNVPFCSHRKFLAFLISLFCAAEASAQTATYRFFRVSILQVRDENGDSVEGPQIAEVDLLLDGVEVTNSAVTVTNPGGDFANPSEAPDKLVDGESGTKWYGKGDRDLVFEFAEPTTLDSYRFVTANDIPDRDPVRWLVEGGNDGVSWTLIGDRSNEDQTIPTQRFTESEIFMLNNLAFPPPADLTIEANGIETATAVGVGAGETVTLSWNVTDALSVTIDFGGGPQAVTSSGTTTRNPTATQTYTLAATNINGTTTETVTAFVDVPEQPVQINEFVAQASVIGALCDEDGDPSDWVELINSNDYAVDLGGNYLTVDSSKAQKWQLPTGLVVEPHSFLIVFASGKNRDTAGSELHADFTLGTDPQYLGILADDGSSVLDEYANYPRQEEDIAYGRVPSGGFNIFTEPTPNQANSTPPGPLGPEVTFITPSGTFTSSLSVELSTTSPSAQIRFTLDGSLPTETSPQYFGPQFIATSTLFRARTFQTGFAPGPVNTRGYMRLNATAAALESDLPVILIENFEGGSIGSGQTLQPAFFSLFEVDSETGKTSLDSEPIVTSRVGIRKKIDAPNDPKLSYRLEFWKDDSDDEKDVSLFGFSEHDEWVLYAPYTFDTSLVRFPFINQLSNDAGFPAPRTRLVEVFVNTEGNVNIPSSFDSDSNDYHGVYVLMERPTVNEDRIDIDPLRKNDRSGGELTGGYVLRIDRGSPGETTFRSARDLPPAGDGDGTKPDYVFDEPNGDDIQAQQETYIKDYIDDLEDSVFGADPGHPTTGFRAFLDVDSAVDRSIFSVLMQDPDSLRFNTYLYKPREGKMHFGPIWDVDRGMSASGETRSIKLTNWVPDVGRADFFTYHWWDVLFDDNDFAQEWIDRWMELRDNEFSNDSINARIDALAAKVEGAQQRNFDRWPSRTPENNSALDDRDAAGQDYSGGDNDWMGEVSHLKGYMTARADWIDTNGSKKLTERPTLDAGGLVIAGASVTLVPNDGVAHYTINGEDPRAPGGGVNPAAIAVTAETQITINATTTIFARTKNPSAGGRAGKFNSEWSGPRKHTFIVGGTPAATGSLVISEIMYHPSDPSPAEITAGFTSEKEFEYLELQNISGGTLDLSGVVVSRAFDFVFPNGFTIPLDGTALLVRNSAGFEQRYGNGITIAGEWGSDDHLGNGGERIIVTGADGEKIVDFTYDDSSSEGWSQAADGAGSSLTLDLPFTAPDSSDSSNWRDSVSQIGSPGEGFDNYCDEWKGNFFTPAEIGNPDISGDEADPDGDGTNNLLELAFGTDPRVTTTVPFIDAKIQSLVVNDVTESYFTVTFSRRRNISGLLAQAEFSNTMNDAWSDKGILISAQDLGNGNEEVTYRDVNPYAGALRFGRVEVDK